MNVVSSIQVSPGWLAGASPWTYTVIGIGAVLALLVLAILLVELLE